MVKNSIKIYARLKQEHQAKTAKANQDLMPLKQIIEIIHCRFEKIFEQQSTQSELFDTIAKPVVNSVLDGFNGTIFAYGQTGSGKTYAITGSSGNYQGRGIIPRSIEEIFEYISKTPDKYTIYISYLEIYNEIGYDLLNPKQQVSTLEELPKVALLEDSKGESHIRNLSVLRVCSEQEAMRLLFLGDTNRTITETPMNVYSSRSHCIFTISINSRNTQSGKIRRSKLNLVDLAGSERINKTNITGTTLNEAKYINLSLHYLEQVILSLSQKRAHIPFRNSMLTYMLKDSLSGNCKTILLAALAVNKKNIEETIATCKFAQRVAEVNMDAIINEEIDPQQEIDCLKTEIESLRKQLVQQSKFRISGKLTKQEKENWKRVVTNYLNDVKDELPLTNFDMRLIQYSFKLLKDAVKAREDQKLKLKSADNENNEVIEHYKELIKQKEEEISALKTLLDDTKSPSTSPASSRTSFTLGSTNSPLQREKENISPESPESNSLTLSAGQKIAFELFMKDSNNTLELEYYKKSIQDMYEIAKKLTAVVEQCQSNIISMRAKHDDSNTDRITSMEVDWELQNQQSIYRNSLEKLHELKEETEELKNGLEKAKTKILEKFKQWYECIGQDDGEMEVKKTVTTKIPTRSPKTSPKVSPKSSSTNAFKRLASPPSKKRDTKPASGKVCKQGGDNNGKQGTETRKQTNKARPKSPPKPENNKCEDVHKENADKPSTKPKRVNFKDAPRKSRSKSLSRSKDTKTESLWKKDENVSSNKTAKNPVDEGTETAQYCKDGKNRPKSAPENNFEDFLMKNTNKHIQPLISRFYEERNRCRSKSPCDSTNSKIENQPKTDDDVSRNSSLGEEEIEIENNCKYHRTRSKRPYYNSEVSWKQNENDNQGEKENSPDNHKVDSRNRPRSPQKPNHLRYDPPFDYDSRPTSPSIDASRNIKPSSPRNVRASSPRDGSQNSRRFSLVYQDIMGYNKNVHSFSDKIEQFLSEIPYSAESGKRLLGVDDKRYLNPQTDNNKVNNYVNTIHPPRKKWNALHSNYSQIRRAAFPTILESTTDETEESEEQDTDNSLVEEKSVINQQRPKNIYQQEHHNYNLQNDPKVMGLRNSHFPQQVNPFYTHQNQTQHGFQNPATVSRNYGNTFHNVPPTVHNVDPRIDSTRGTYNGIRTSNLFSPDDSPEFMNFIRTIPLTGDAEVDDEIIKFYRTRFVYTGNI